jgi:hypothetical protein
VRREDEKKPSEFSCKQARIEIDTKKQEEKLKPRGSRIKKDLCSLNCKRMRREDQDKNELL